MKQIIEASANKLASHINLLILHKKKKKKKKRSLGVHCIMFYLVSTKQLVFLSIRLLSIYRSPNRLIVPTLVFEVALLQSAFGLGRFLYSCNNLQNINIDYSAGVAPETRGPVVL